ncbi:MAG: carboxypeptidase regulatory-like domain-containing protein [Nannocystaceae bacterium]
MAGERRRRPWLLGAGAGLVLALVAAVIVARIGDDGETVDPPLAATGSIDEGRATAAAVSTTITLRGEVRIEDPAPAPAGDGSGRDASESEGDDDGTGGGEGAPPAPRLQPPPSCTAFAWSSGERLAGPVHCDGEGRYTLLVDGSPAQVAVEVLVPGRLRGLLEAPISGDEVQLPTLALGPASLLVGQVIDARGQPVPSVSIQARPRPDLGESEPWRVSAGADGRFRLDTIPSGPIVLEARAPGYAPTILEVVAPEETVVIVLDGLRDLEGDVLGPPDLLARAKVRIEGSSIWPPIEVPVAGDGSFRIPQIPDGVYSLVAESPAGPGGGPEYASLPIENVTPDMQVSMALIQALRIPVKVIDGEGTPIAGARITLSGSSIGMLQKVDTTDAQGALAVGPVVPGPYLLHADADGYLPSEMIAVDAQIDVPLPPIELRMLRPARILGIVVDEEGGPVAAATISVESDVLYSPGESLVRARTISALMAGGSLGITAGVVPPIPLFGDAEVGRWIEGATQSDNEGRFLLDMLAPGTYRLRASHEAHAASGQATVPIHAGEVRGDVRLVLAHGEPLTGRIRDTNFQPIAFARIELDDGSVFTTDGRGVFDAGLHRGARRLVIRAPGMIPQAVEVQIGDRPVDLERILQPASGAIEGRLRDSNDRPITGARIALYPDDGLSPTSVTYSDERGLFNFDALTPGGAVVEVDHPDFAAHERRLRVPARADGRLLEIGLSAGWILEFHVRAAGSGDPIAGATVRAGGHNAVTDAAGDAILRRLAAAQVTATVEAAGWVREKIKVARPDDGPAEATVELEEGAGMEGHLQDERGEPVAHARIVVRDRRSGEILAETESDADGAWVVERLSEGDVTVEATPPADLAAILAPVSMDSDVLRGQVTRGVDLRFDRL